jgi:hypothetical protein
LKFPEPRCLHGYKNEKAVVAPFRLGRGLTRAKHAKGVEILIAFLFEPRNGSTHRLQSQGGLATRGGRSSDARMVIRRVSPRWCCS